MHLCFPNLPEHNNHLGAGVKNENSSLTTGLALDVLFSLLVQKIPNPLPPTFHELKGVLFLFVSCRPGPVQILSTLFNHRLPAFIVGCIP